MNRTGFFSIARRYARHLTRRGESGQAIIILALGFIALIAFVGIVTDVSLMFVRYSTLSRAVDAAAIAAAGQMRSDRSFGEVGLAARQFIEFHGLNPVEVLVETCQTVGTDTDDKDGDGNTTESNDPELCPSDQRKLVRVSAKIESPTIFMRLLGFPNLELSVVALSETAVLDVVIIMDVSESMLFDTSYSDWAEIGMGKVYVPPRLGGNASPIENDVNGNDIPDAGDLLTWNPADNNTIYQKEFLDQFNLTDTGAEAIGPDWVPDKWSDAVPILQRFWDSFVLPEVSLQQDVNDRLFYEEGGSEGSPTNQPDPDYFVEVYDDPASVGVQQAPRFDCRVRFWPYSTAVEVDVNTRATYDALGITYPAKWDGFVPSYNFYGCCNDPTSGGQIDESGALVPMSGATITYGSGDNKFNDLICQPFKQARDATRQFLERIDFARGDRVAFVTFDKGSFLIDPDGGQGIPVPSENPLTPGLCAGELANGIDTSGNGAPDRTALNHMIESECRALITLDKDLGVRAEPNFYVWKDDGGGWDGYADGLTDEGKSRRVYYNYRAGDPVYNDPAGTPYYGEQVVNNYPVRDNCPLQNGALGGLRSKYSTWTRGDYNQFGIARAGLYRTMIPSPDTGAWAGVAHLDERNSYELWASCRGTNVGAALRAASNALLDPSTTRRTGTVWVMVMLSDGAAGASDPVRQSGEEPSVGKINLTSGDIGPYADLGPDPADWESYGINPSTGDPFTQNIRYGTVGGARTTYGAFGLCPLGYPGGGETRLTRAIPDGESATFPFCSDVEPWDRHFCLPPDAEPTDITENADEVGGQCPPTAGVDETASGTFASGFAPGSKDVEYNCNPSDLDPDETVEDYNLLRGNLYDVDIGTWPGNMPDGTWVVGEGCDPLYDVDDYARDWADYIGLSRGSGDQQLPSIFTIGFGLNFPNGATGDPDDSNYVPGPASDNIPDYLGEELLRYIADVGDNFQIDTDYQQDWRDDGERNDSLSDAELGVRGPCESPFVPEPIPNAPPNQPGYPYISPLLPRTNCGNYYNAPNQAQLELVFNDIASRMFTRLSG